MKRKGSHPDYILASIIFLLIFLGAVALASVSVVFSQERFGSPTFFLFRQIIIGFLPGILLGFLAYKISLDFLKKWSPLLLLITLVCMILVFVPKVGLSLGGAARWISLGPVSFQPSEFLKISFILYLAAWLNTRIGSNLPALHEPSSGVSKIRRIKTAFQKVSFDGTKDPYFARALFPFLLIIGLTSLLLTLQPDISTLGVIILVSGSMYFLAGSPLRHIVLITSIGIVGLVALIQIAPYRLNRFLIFLNPDIDPMGLGYQIKQALITVGSGGITGLGLGMSVQKFGFLPQPMSDSIFAIFSEETGFLGALVLILLFLVFLWRGFEISKKAKDGFLKLAAAGISLWIVLQAFINIGAMVGILPLTGIPLPFISYGGSALVAELIGVGILLNISKQNT